MSEDRTPVRASYLDRVKPQARLHKPEPPRRTGGMVLAANSIVSSTSLTPLIVKTRFDRDLSVRSLLGNAVLQPRPEGLLSDEGGN